MTYYKEIARAERKADHIINETLYINKEWIDLNQLEIDESPKYACNFMKVFKKRLSLYMKKDSEIIQDKELVFIRRKKEE